ncbi:hypothetical protein M5689_003631 [Euphorbia peplus]|nr:hypothetical protein M5689_003631 [Euphorbia peplus]
MSTDPPPASSVDVSTAPPSSIHSSDPTAYMRVPSTKPSSSGPVLEEVRMDSIEDAPDKESFSEVGQTVANVMGSASSERLIFLLTRLAGQSRALVIPTVARVVSATDPLAIPLLMALSTPPSSGIRPHVLFPSSGDTRPHTFGLMGNFQPFLYFSLTLEQLYLQAMSSLFFLHMMQPQYTTTKPLVSSAGPSSSDVTPFWRFDPFTGQSICSTCPTFTILAQLDLPPTSKVVPELVAPDAAEDRRLLALPRAMVSPYRRRSLLKATPLLL